MCAISRSVRSLYIFFFEFFFFLPFCSVLTVLLTEDDGEPRDTLEDKMERLRNEGTKVVVGGKKEGYEAVESIADKVRSFVRSFVGGEGFVGGFEGEIEK